MLFLISRSEDCVDQRRVFAGIMQYFSLLRLIAVGQGSFQLHLQHRSLGMFSHLRPPQFDGCFGCLSRCYGQRLGLLVCIPNSFTLVPVIDLWFFHVAASSDASVFIYALLSPSHCSLLPMVALSGIGILISLQ